MIYFDSAASTSVSPSVLDCFVSANQDYYANPSSVHVAGRQAGRKLEEARKELLSFFGLVSSHQALYLSGATEANNLALKGVAKQYQNRGKKILVSSVEHPSVLEVAHYLGTQGFEVIELPVDCSGHVLPDTLASAMDKDVILVSIMGVNNETGAINDLSALAKIAHAYPKCFFHSDLTQAIGKVEIPYKDLDLFSFSAHKLHGLKGSGALIYKSSMRFVPVLHGGGQEMGFRSGTVSLPTCLALNIAVKEALISAKANLAHVDALSKALYEGLAGEQIRFNSSQEGSSYIGNFSLLHHKASVIVEALSEEGICVSSASACSAKTDRASTVLLAMGKSHDDASNAIRVSFSKDNSLEEVETFLTTLKRILKEVHVR